MKSLILKPICILLLMLVVLSSCKNDKKTQTQTITVRLEADPDRLNPMLSSTGYSTDVFRYIFYPLADIDPFSLKMAPVLIKTLPAKYTVETGVYKGKSAYKFYILNEAKWDNGTPITGFDFAFTLKAAFNPLVASERWRAPMGFVQDVLVDEKNPKTFSVVVNEEYFLADILLASINIYPEYLFDSKAIMRKYSLADLIDPVKSAQMAQKEAGLKEFADEFNNAKYGRDPEFVMGAGPYKLVEWTTGQKIVLKKKSNWWGDALSKQYPMLQAYPEQLIFKIVADNVTTISMLKDGQLDALGGFSASQYKEVSTNKSIADKYNIFTPTVLQYLYFGLNLKNPKLSDKKVRQALSHLLDLDATIGLLDGLGERIIGPFHPSKEYYNHTLKPIALDINKANQLLDEAGWKDSDGNGVRDKMIEGVNTPLDLTISLGTSSEIGKKLSLMMQENAKKAGINIVLDAREMSQVMADVKAGKFEISPLKNRLDPVLDDPYNSWNSANITAGGGNRIGYSNPEADKLTELIRTTKDEKIRNQSYQKFQEILYEDQPVIFLYAPKEPVLIAKKFEQAKPSVIKPGFALNYIH